MIKMDVLMRKRPTFKTRVKAMFIIAVALGVIGAIAKLVSIP